MTTSRVADARFATEASRGPRNARTLRLQMEMARAQQKELADRIKELRGHRPQPVMAEMIGVTLRAYQRWEAGGGIAWRNIQRIADVHNVSTNYLLYGEAEPRGPQTQLDRMEEMLRRLVEAQIEREISDAALLEPTQERDSEADADASERTETD